MAKQLTQHEKYDAEKLLGLTNAYDKKVLKKVYLNKVREWHPDVASSHGHTPEEGETMTKKINNAFVLLMSQFDASVTTVQCESSPTAASANATGASARHTSNGGTARQSHADYDWTAYATDSDTSATDQSQSYEPVGRGATPKNMDASVRYTRIVTDSNYVKWFVSGIGPHIVWAIASLAFLFVCGVLMAGALGLGGIAMLVRLLPILVVYDVVTGHGAEVVLSVADIWAVNKAVRG